MHGRRFPDAQPGALQILCAGLVCLAVQFAAIALDDPWADTVLDFNAIAPLAGFTDPARVIGPPVGGGTLAPNNSQVYCIGCPGDAPGSFITVKFDSPIMNDPNNPFGIDFAVHGNAFWVGGVPTRRWAEPGLVQISQDVNGNGIADDPWYVIPGSRALSAAILPAGIPNPSPPLAGNVLNPNTNGIEYDWGYSDLSPTIQEYRDNYLRPDDPLAVGLTPYSGGGDGFDISWAVNTAGQDANLTQADFIRVSAFINGSISGFGTVAPEISAVVDIAPPIDTDDDGVLDAYETRCSGTDPLRPESTVLPLEVPAEYGGSPAGTQLGQAADSLGNAITLFSLGTRTGTRLFNCNVDIQPATIPAVPVPGRLASGAARLYTSTVADFPAAQTQNAQLTLAYASASITGLDEASLEPWRFDGTQWTQAGISEFRRDPANNLVTFRSTMPGLFVLASVAGTGDQDVSAIPVAIHATPASGTVADGSSIAAFLSDPILDRGTPVPDGTLLTVTVSPPELATAITADADPGTEGVQIAVSGSTVSFSLRAATLAGRATVRTATADGLIAGELGYAFLPGPPAEPTQLWLQNPDATAPGPVYFFTGEIRDEYGNRVSDGTQVTLEVTGANPVGIPDADTSQPGYQLRVSSGIVNFTLVTVTAHAGDMLGVQVRLYAEPTLETVLAEGSFDFQYFPVPGPCPFLVAPLLSAAGILLLQRARTKRRTP